VLKRGERLPSLHGRVPHGFISIEYNKDLDVYTYHGAAYNKDMDLVSRWNCDDLDINPSHGTVIFMCDSRRPKSHTDLDQGESNKAFGYITFTKGIGWHSDKYMSGDGYYTVIGSTQLKGEFNVERLDPKLVRDIMGRKNVNMNDIPILLRKLQEEKQKE
jgi:hypothetical protein